MENGAKNWIPFQSEMENGKKIGQMPKPTATAFLEPLELNEIPLNDFDPMEGPENGQQNIGTKSNEMPKIMPPPRPLNVPKPPNSQTVQYQKTPNNNQNKEIILVPSESPGTSNNSSSSSGPAGTIVESNKVVSSGKAEDFKNGKLLITVFPNNGHCAWIIPPQYDYKMPSILGNKHNALPASIYMEIIQTICSDLRFFSYAVLYSRITPIWLIFSIIILLAVLASSPAEEKARLSAYKNGQFLPANGGFPIMIFALVWLFMLVFGILLCVFIRKYIVLSLRNLLKDVNKVALQYRLLVGVQDKGQLSCHKVALMFIFYDPSGCKEDVLKLIRVHQANFPIAGQRPMSESELAQNADDLLCHYSQAYAKAYMKRQFLLPTRPSEGVSEFRPKHCQKNLCICQYIERDHFNKSSEKKVAPWYERVFAV